MPSSRRGVLVWFVACAFGLAAILIALVVLADPPAPVWRLVALAIGAHLPYGLLLLLGWRRWIPGGAWTVIGLAALLRITLVFAPPTFSDDIHRYVWDGRVVVAGHNPFKHPPVDPTLEHLQNEEWSEINNPELRTIYPPVAQMLFAGWASVWPTATGFKALSVVFDIAVVCLVILLAGGSLSRSRGSPGSALDRHAALAGAFYGWSPVACIETGMSGHLEPLALLPMLGAVLLFNRARASRGSPGLGSKAAGWLSPAVLGLASATKLAPILLWPVLGRRDWRFWLGVPLLLVVVYLPFASAGGYLFETTGTFVRSWEGNAGVFAAIKAGAAELIGVIYGVAGADEIVHVSWLDGPAQALEGTFFTLHTDGGFDPTAPGAFTVNDLSLAVAKIVVGLCLAAVLGVCFVRRFEPMRAGLWLFGLMLLASPVVHPWYLLWVLPFAAVRLEWPWLVLGAALPLAYLPLDGWWARSSWEAPIWIPWVEYGLFFAAFAVWFVRRRSAGGRSTDQVNQQDIGGASG
ncbi:MAG: hypothetical protein JRF63_07055 [Deltaproteobacteria bacterium]|nr:hypothetical protein [Deltaproteobacteria bacterium]